MGNWDMVKLASDGGVVAVMLVALILFYRLLDKYGAAFLAAQQAQATAMTEQAGGMASLAAAIREGQSDQKEVLYAVRLLADRLEQQKEYLVSLDANCRQRRCA